MKVILGWSQVVWRVLGEGVVAAIAGRVKRLISLGRQRLYSSIKTYCFEIDLWLLLKLL